MPDGRRPADAIAGFWGALSGVLGTVTQRAERGYGSVPAMLRLLVFAILLILIPYYINPFSGDVFFDNRWLVVFRLVGLYIILGIGLNVVVGYAGLLDLGYVAFFACGAYLWALLASPVSPAIEFPIGDVPWLFWPLLPGALVVGALVGVALGVPVLRLRGDYLAIVTLGFGEIIRLFLVNAEQITGGSQGLYRLEPPPLPEVGVATTELGPSAYKEWYFIMIVAVFLIAFAAGRMRDSRLGRAWEAIREDEDVAAAMGVNTVKYKLLAFAMGAGLGAIGGMLFAAFQGAAIPSSFSLLVSINVLAIVVIGGMGNTWGVVIGAFVLVGIPEFLRFREAEDLFGLIDPLLPVSTQTWADQVSENRFIVFGALLVVVMVLRPIGILPSQRRKLEAAWVEEEAAA